MPRNPDNPSDIDLGKISLTLLGNWKLIGLTAFAAAAAGAAVSFFSITPIFESFAVLIPQQADRPSALSSLVGGGSPLGQLIGISGETTELLRYQEVLRSQSFTRSLIEKHELLKLRTDQIEKKAMYMELKIKELQSNTETEVAQNILRISYRDTSAEFSKQMVTWYLEQLKDTFNEKTVTQSKNTELFIAERLKEIEAELTQSEARYLAMQKQKGIVQLPSQITMSLNTVSRLRSQLIEKEMEIGLQREIMKDSSELKRLESERQILQKQIDRLVQGKTDLSKKPSGFVSLAEGPSLEFEYANAERNYLTLVKLAELLKQQYEVARIDSKRSEPLFHIIDPPTASYYPVWPKKKLITVVSALLGLLLASLYVLTADRWRRPMRRMQAVSAAKAERGSDRLPMSS